MILSGRRSQRISVLGVICCLAGAGWSRNANSAELPPHFQPAITANQIEADWLVQAKLRFGASSAQMTTTRDAAGGCDGTADGSWGFHTAQEANPWWQVDLGRVQSLDRLVIYNRCDGGFAARAARLIVSIGNRPEQLQQVYQHDGQVFHGHRQGPPLSISLEGQPARFVRLQLPGVEYLHLDEVQVFAVGHDANIALQRPANQSSISQWSTASAQSDIDWPTVVSQTLDRGRLLADTLETMHVPVAACRQDLHRIAAQTAAFPSTSTVERWQQPYVAARWAIRRLLLAHPLLDFDTILFVKRAPTQFPHLSDQYYGWWSRPGGGVYLLRDFQSIDARIRCLTDGFAPGNFLRPDLHFDAGRLVFAYCRYDPNVAELPDKASKISLPEEAFYHLYEMNLDGSDPHRLTHGRYDDFDARYLPDDRILFLSTRKGTFLQCSSDNTAQTLQADLPDSYVRCGGDIFRPVPVFTLHAMDGHGQNMAPISAFETFEYTPSIANDGRILYCRWDYIDRFNGHFFSLWSTDQSGGGTSLVYGNYTKRPQATMEARGIPGSNKILLTAAAHHSITGGSLVLLDPNRGTEGDEPITRLTPEVPFPETEQNVDHYYVNPWPLSEDLYLVSWATQPLPPHGRILDDRNPIAAQGIYLLDRSGNLELLYRDPQISSMTPIPVRVRPRPPVHSTIASPSSAQVGAFLLQDIYQGLTGIARGQVKRLRIIGVPPKVQPQMNVPALGVSREETGKYVMGSVDVEADGSAYFQLPSGVPVFFQALDARGRALQTMRSLAYVQSGELRSCVGCHEGRHTAPSSGGMPLAARRAPSRLKTECEGTWPLRYDRLVQPVLEQNCVSCHQKDREGARFDLTEANSYGVLLQYAEADLHHLVFEKDASQPSDSPSLHSKLLSFLQEDELHVRLELPSTELQRLYLWMDTYGHSQGCFSHEQEEALLQLKRQYAFLLAN